LSSNSANGVVVARYAFSLFDLAKEQKDLPATDKDAEKISIILEKSEDFVRFIKGGLISRDEQMSAIVEIADKARFSDITVNFLKVLTKRGRLSLLPEIIADYKKLCAEYNEEITADVTVVDGMSSEQQDNLKTMLSAVTGIKTVNLRITNDKEIMGGLVVKVGSMLIDNSVKTKLNKLHEKLRRA